MSTRRIHPWPVRLTHWLNAMGMVGMFMSGWGIYNASPLFPFSFPRSITLGGWLGGSIGWHLAVMWLLVINGLAYMLYGVFSRHFKSDLLPVTPSAVKRDFIDALRFRLAHQHGRYNAVQRLSYWIVMALGVLVVLSGLSIWKPIQLQVLANLFGGYDFARYVHFGAMAGIGAFVVVHLVLVLLVPRTFMPMITGGTRENSND
ncbi:cytochrome b/b6 domain-containing protein [Pseudomonas sp. 10B1]|uniref:cytochrome b/b6 domain-containing protein n=1 Tax=unclassified Pseudomonas TaxID=196821 RepID=UPI002AB4EB31|nr:MULTISPECIES: cytochrome b/b6 domain-containing protein [unclassified Pseudomonas]MDY7559482.1 cytochrome b/b6 domain-containing protein [Pseudomonas sp. AB6]MEA9979479.1 cytochrome b/b6 domain-containing protein [Pseudomonas sp. RTS4]MEA9995679.1 cytochrome b/b6 domain-containing protein [Pseudomonas sp. AA4]MEB0087994.1 cytochrome b/b6 domain-containing protein [Pseudomonas sp. RTI1]MEB0126988.1 cytochrome b/b6 domain-containing protein [Pseudomonas sp. CCC1.2]